MKLKTDFVTNSSSTAYLITNKSNKVKTIVEFAEENKELLDQFKQEYDWYEEDMTIENLLDSAESRLELNREKYTILPGEVKYCVFGDEQADIIGKVYDYILRSGGSSENFVWQYCEALR